MELNEAELSRLGHSTAVVRWENLEDGPQWIDGVCPTFDRRLQQHVLPLAAGQYVSFRVPPRGMIRVADACGRELHPDEVDIWFSNGSGLYQKAAVAEVSDDGSLLAVPGASHTGIARVIRVRATAKCEPLLVFTSRILPMEFATGKDCKLEGCGPKVRLAVDTRSEQLAHYKLAAGRSAQLEVCGPTRLRFDTRLDYECGESASRQNYQFFIYVDDTLTKIVEFDASSELRHRVFVEGCEEVVGQREFGYFDVPHGQHQITIQTTASVFARVEAHDDGDYARPHLNALHSLPRRNQQLVTPDKQHSLWQIPPGEVQPFVELPGHSPAAVEAVALRLARDNRYRGGGLRSWLMMRAAAQARPGEPRVQVVADEMKAMYSHYRSLLPVSAPLPMQPRNAWFTTRRIRDPGEKLRGFALPEQLVDDALLMVADGQFMPLGSGVENSLLYRIPNHVRGTVLRIAVDRTLLDGPANIRMQFEFEDGTQHGDPVMLQALTQDDLPPSDYVPSRADAGLSAIHHRDRYDAGTLGGPFAARHRPGYQLDVATAELNVPSDVRAIRLWQPEYQQRQVNIAFQYRDSRTYQLTESAYRPMSRIARIGVPNLLDVALSDEPPLSYQAREIRNHWVPIVRYLRSRAEDFALAVEPPAEVIELLPPSGEYVEQLFQEADELHRQGEWSSAVEAWSKALPYLAGERRRKALLNRAGDLQSAGESFLSERELRGLAVFDPDPVLRESALLALAERYTADGNTAALERLLCHRLVHEKSAQAQLQLARLLVEDANYRFAILLLLDSDQPDPELVAECAYQLGWWQTFESAIEQLPPPDRAFWLGLKQQFFGDYRAAIEYFDSAADRGRLWHQHLRAGTQIFDQLTSSNLSQRVHGVFAWEQWQQEHPGPRVWSSALANVETAAKYVSIQNPRRHIQSEAFVSRPDMPARLRVHGPVRLKLDIRPLHPSGTDLSMNDWLTIRCSHREYLVAITGNRYSRGLQLPDEPSWTPGSLVTQEIVLGPGLHEVAVAAREHDVLVQPWVQRPAIPLGVLPAITNETLAAVLSGSYARKIAGCFHQTSADGSGNPMRLQLIQGGCSKTVCSCRGHRGCARPACLKKDCDGQACFLPFIQSCALPTQDETPIELRGLSAEDYARISLRTGMLIEQDIRVLSALADEPGALPKSEQQEIQIRYGELPDVLDWGSGPFRKLPPYEQQAILLSQGMRDAAASVDCEGVAQAIEHQANMLVEAGEMGGPQARLEALVALNLLLEHAPQIPALATLQTRLVGQGDWSLFREYETSAGVHGMEFPEWNPESPQARIRKSLFQSSESADYVLFGDKMLTIRSQRTEETRLVLQLKRRRVSYVPYPLPKLAWRVDTGDVQTKDLDESANQWDSLTFDLPAGERVLRFWMTNPHSNQYVSVRVFKQAADGSLAPWREVEMAAPKRMYQVATNTEPIRFNATYPAWLRIDELRDGYVRSELINVDRDRAIELRPPHGHDQGLFRVFTFTPSSEASQVTSYMKSPAVTETPDPWTSVSAAGIALASHEEAEPYFDPFYPNDVAPVTIGLASLALHSPDRPPLRLSAGDAMPPRFHEDGTWAVGSGLTQRRALEDSPEFGSQEDRFVELQATHLQHDYWRDLYTRNSVVTRARSASGPTLGFVHDGWRQLNDLRTYFPSRAMGCDYPSDGKLDDWTLRWNGYAYLQRPSEAIPSHEMETEFSLGGMARLSRRFDVDACWYHSPSLTVRGRWLSLDEMRYLPGRVDQDIFTQYRSDHRIGLRVSDRWVYQRYLDTKWWVLPAVSSNEDLNLFRPDNATVLFGMSQLWGGLQLDVGYRLGHFFDDDDRSSSSTQHLLVFDANLERWQHAGRRWDVAFQLRQDLSGKGTGANVFLTTYRSRGRGYEDFHPSQIMFLPVKKQRAAYRWLENRHLMN